MNWRISILLWAFTLFVTACAPIIERYPEYSRKYKHIIDGIEKISQIDPYKVKQPIPKKEPKSKYGNPKSYTVFGKRYYVLNSAKGYKQRGKASWYGKKFHGERTSSGEIYNMYAMTAAHKTLPLPTYVKVTNLQNKKNIIVRLNDRGPFHDGRIIDLSYSAAKQLSIVARGTAQVEVEAIDPDKKSPQSYIQVGAFREIKNAYALAEKLRGLFNFPVLVSKKKANKQWLSTVKVGPFISQTLENSALKQIIEQGYNLARIVK